MVYGVMAGGVVLHGWIVIIFQYENTLRLFNCLLSA